jgi:hypothetical protein
MTFTFYLDDILIDEPVGFADIQLRVKRDPVWHGIFFEATTNDMKFYGTAATYLMNKKREEGFGADVTFRAETDCGSDTEVFSGKLDFRQYKERCGTDCFVTIPVEQEGCLMTLRNRYDQKVDLSDRIAFDKNTILPDYDGLNFTMGLAAQELSLGNRAETGDNAITTVISDDPVWTPHGGDDFVGYISPAYTVIKNASFGIFTTTDLMELTEDGANNIPPYPSFPVTVGTANLLDGIQCEITDVVATFRHKGTVTFNQSGAGALQFLRLKLWRLPVGLDGTVFSNWVEEYSNEFYGVNTDAPVAFDVSATVPMAINPGDFFYYGICVIANDLSNIDLFEITQDAESFFQLNASSLCEETYATVSLVHEAASRVVESITDRCMNVKSDYYGRTDSEPYAAAEDGCGGLRILSNGLRIRTAETQNHFISLKEVFDGLNAIDNIGLGIETGTVYEPDVVRIEPVEYFYQDVEIMRHPSIPSSDKETQADLAYSLVKIGYKKWETENVNGLDEFNSNKEFRTSLKTISNPLDATSNFIAGGYPIEHTRQQSFAETGAADTKYDNDTFIVCVKREPYPANYIVEQGNIDNASGMYSPSTAYNWRIRPFYNLMRWWKSVAQSYVNLVNTTSRLLFSAGTGNLLAEGELTNPDDCKIETVVKAENDDLGVTDMSTGQTPIWKPDNMVYSYPMSLKDYNIIKAAPFGYLYAQCGNGEFEKGFIQNIVYRLAKGEADITLRLKWDT